MGTDTDPLCQTGATTVERDRPMRLHCRRDRAWPCPIGPVVALGGTVDRMRILCCDAGVRNWQEVLSAGSSRFMAALEGGTDPTSTPVWAVHDPVIPAD